MKEIEKIIRRHDQIDWSQEKTALGTVVRVEASAYRRIGARMYVSSNGNWEGGISGGCLEGDALKRALIAISKNKSSVVVYDTMEDDAHQIGVGLGCNGKIEVMFTPIDPRDAQNPIEMIRHKVSSRRLNLVYQIIAAPVSNEMNLGKVYEAINDLARDTHINPATLAIEKEDILDQQKSKVCSFTNSLGETYTILYECLMPKTRVICIGDNYDVNAFIEVAHPLGWEIHVAGKKRKMNKYIFDHAASISSYEAAVDIPIDSYTAVILMSHDYKTDLDLLQHYIHTDVPYIGLLGPKKRMEKMQKELNAVDIDIDLYNAENLHAPVGLDIGAESPEEIAVSIISEILSVMRNRNGKKLRYRKGPIHKREM